MSHGGPGGGAVPAPAHFPGLGESHACSWHLRAASIGGGRVTGAPLPRGRGVVRGQADAPALPRAAPLPARAPAHAAHPHCSSPGRRRREPPASNPRCFSLNIKGRRFCPGRRFALNNKAAAVARAAGARTGRGAHSRPPPPRRPHPCPGAPALPAAPRPSLGAGPALALPPPLPPRPGGAAGPGRAAARGGAVARGGLRGRAEAERTDGRRRGSCAGSGGVRAVASSGGRRA